MNIGGMPSNGMLLRALDTELDFWLSCPCSSTAVNWCQIHAFSIDNFRSSPEEVQYLTDLILEKIEGILEQESIINEYGVRIHFVGNLKLLDEPVRVAAEKAIQATANNTKRNLLICVAYTSTDEIVHAISEEITEEKLELDHVIKLVDLERHTHMGLAPDPDVLIRTSGASHSSNFLLWQTTNCLRYSPKVLFPEIGLQHLVWAVVNFQRLYPHLEKEKKQL